MRSGTSSAPSRKVPAQTLSRHSDSTTSCWSWCQVTRSDRSSPRGSRKTAPVRGSCWRAMSHCDPPHKFLPRLVHVPELPEVEALAQDLRGRLVGRAISRIDLAAFSALKTFDPPLHALHGTLVDDVTRHGKFLDIDASGVHVVIHLARAGWIRWRDEVPALPARPNSKNPLAVRIVIDDEVGLDITEAGTKKSLALYVVRAP